MDTSRRVTTSQLTMTGARDILETQLYTNREGQVTRTDNEDRCLRPWWVFYYSLFITLIQLVQVVRPTHHRCTQVQRGVHPQQAIVIFNINNYHWRQAQCSTLTLTCASSWPGRRMCVCQGNYSKGSKVEAKLTLKWHVGYCVYPHWQLAIKVARQLNSFTQKYFSFQVNDYKGRVLILLPENIHKKV